MPAKAQAQVIPLNATRAPSTNALIEQTRAAWDRADLAQADADDWYKRTGKLLVELKAKVGHGQWLPTLKQLGRSQRRAEELMEGAKDSGALERQRKRKRDHERKVRANARHGAHKGNHRDGKMPEGYAAEFSAGLRLEPKEPEAYAS